MRPGACAAVVLLVALLGPPHEDAAADGSPSRVFDGHKGDAPATPLDELVIAAQRRARVQMAPPCSDEVFVRRVFMDVLGTLPDADEVRAFTSDRSAGRRERLIDSLFERPEYADLWSLRWCDTLRVKSEFPIKLWPNAVQAYHHWVRDAVRRNLPYDTFARALLTSSGSNFRVPPVNFFRAVQERDPDGLAGAVALTFLGARIDSWSEERRAGLAALLSRVRYKRTHEWKEEIVYCDPAPLGPLHAVLPDGTEVTVPDGVDPRSALADWMVRDDNMWFARVAVNRVWAWLFGTGLVDEPDDFRDDNPPLMPDVLDHLAGELVKSGWDLRHVLRLILRSRTYQQSPIPRGDPVKAGHWFACYPVRRLDAEVLVDALCKIGGRGETYLSRIPEPWTWVPEENRTIALADGSITSAFLVLFGRPSRDTGRSAERSNEPSDDQLLHLLNSTDVRRRIEGSPQLARVVRAAGRDVNALIEGVYLTLLSRAPRKDEIARVRAYFLSGERRGREAAADLAWALVNSREFLYRH